MTMLAVLALLALWRPAVSQAPPQELDFAPVGVRYAADANPARRAIDHDTIGRARFNVVAAPADATGQTTALTRVDRPALGAPPASVAVRTSDLGIVPITATTTAETVKETAWTLFARGSRGVIFDDWLALQQNAAALAEASAFAQTITSNMALYAPLRHVEQTGARAIAVKGGEGSVESALARVSRGAAAHRRQPRRRSAAGRVDLSARGARGGLAEHAERRFRQLRRRSDRPVLRTHPARARCPGADDPQAVEVGRQLQSFDGLSAGQPVRHHRRAPPDRAGRAQHATARRLGGGGPAVVPQVREHAAGRRVQDSRRLQHGRAPDRRPAAPRRHHVFLGQSRPGHGARRARSSGRRRWS